MKKIVVALLLSLSSLFAFEHLTIDNFDEKIKDKKVIVDFYAPWCPPCKIIEKTLNKYEANKKENTVIYKVNIDKQRALLDRFGVKSIPTLVYVNNGEVKVAQAGVRSLDEIKNNVEKYLH